MSFRGYITNVKSNLRNAQGTVAPINQRKIRFAERAGARSLRNIGFQVFQTVYTGFQQLRGNPDKQPETGFAGTRHRRMANREPG